PEPGRQERHWLYVRGLDEKEPGTFAGVHAETFAWSADGTEIAYSDLGKAKEGEKQVPMVHGITNFRGGVRTALKLPADHAIIDWSRDGKFFVTQHVNDTDFPALFLVSRDGGEPKRLTDEKAVSFGGRLSPDSKRLLYASVIPPKEKTDFGVL